VDHHGGKLLRSSIADDGHAHFRACGEITNTQEAHQHGRPSPKKGKGGHTYVSWRHEEEELRRRYAGEVSRWLAKRTKEFRVRQLLVFAPARLLGALREAWTPELGRCIEEHVGDLSYLTLRELAQHPVIASCLKQGLV
jgi:hypothetical protein